MVVLTPHFTFLAALSSIAAVSLLPTSAEGAAIQIQSRDAVGHSLVVRHSSHGSTETVADVQSGTGSSKVKHASKKSTSKDATAKPQRHPKPIMPLPARMAQKNAHKASSLSQEGSSGAQKHAPASGSKHKQSSRTARDSSDPVARVRSLWLGSRDATSEAVSNPGSHVGRRHHHHGNHHDEVVVKGNHDHVNVHRRSLWESRSSEVTRDDHDRVTVEGHDDHVHYHDRGHDAHDHVVVKGDNDHVHVQRSPSPHHHHHNDKVIVKGDHDTVHVHRSPTPAPHSSNHHHHDKVVVKGNHDHVNVHGRSPAPHHHHGHTVVVKGNNEHVNVRRSPSPLPEPHHHHHHDHHDAAKVVVNGDDDHVKIHNRRTPAFGYRYPVVISGNGGASYLVHHNAFSQDSTDDGGLLDMKLHLRRDGQVSGVPGSIDIMSPVANSDMGQRIASLVLAAPTNGSTADNSTSSNFVLNASEVDRTQMYLVTAPDSGNSSSSNSTANNSTAPSSFIKVALQMPVFDAASAQLKPYCATFDPRPTAPAPMTVESCMNGSSVDEHKSQVFAYEPDSGAIRPMWYEGEDDGTDDDDDSTSPTDDSPSASGPSGDDEGDSDDSDDSTTVDPTTPTSDKVASVTSFNQQALDNQFGDATRPPTRAAFAEAFSAEALSSARNVTLVFSPAAPEVPSRPPGSVISSTGSAPLTEASTTATPTSTDTMATSPAVLAASGTLTSDGTSSDPASTAPSSTTSNTDTNTGASATPSPALEVKVYNPYAEGISSDALSSSMATPSATTSSSISLMTPVSTAPYEWMFKQGALTDLE